MISPDILAIFVLVFVGLGVYNIYSGRKKMLAAREQGLRLPWYKQINILTGAEYLLLSLVFLISLDFKALPAWMRTFVIPFYFVTLALSAVLAVMVIRQGISNARRRPAQNMTMQRNRKVVETEVTTNHLSSEERAVRIARRRKRRQNAVAARRRKAGKA